MEFLENKLRKYSPEDVMRALDRQQSTLAQRFGWQNFSTSSPVKAERYGLKGEAKVSCNGVECLMYVICLHPQHGTGNGDSSEQQKTQLRSNPKQAHEWVLGVEPCLFVFRYSAEFYDGKVPEVFHEECQVSRWSRFATHEDLLASRNPADRQRDVHAVYNPTPWSQLFLVASAPVGQALRPLEKRLVEMTALDKLGKKRYIVG